MVEQAGQGRQQASPRQVLADGAGAAVALVPGAMAGLQARLDLALEEVAQLRRILDDAAGHAILCADGKGRITRWNAVAEAITGCTAVEVLGHPVDRDGVDGKGVIFPAELALAFANGAAPIERWYDRPGGGRAWLSGTVVRLSEGDGGLHGFLAVMRDRSAARVELSNHELLVDEMRHRLKNSYGLVQAIAAQTARHEPTQMGFLATFAGRLSALARASDLLVSTGRDDVPLAQLVDTILAPYCGEPGRITMEGSSAVTLDAGLATMAGLILHELATNAAKYGALSSGAGSLAVRWTVDPVGGRIELAWREQGGPPVQPPAAAGFGTRLLASGGLQGILTRTEFEPEGLRCAMTLPIGPLEEGSMQDRKRPSVVPQDGGAQG